LFYRGLRGSLEPARFFFAFSTISSAFARLGSYIFRFLPGSGDNGVGLLFSFDNTVVTGFSLLNFPNVLPYRSWRRCDAGSN